MNWLKKLLTKLRILRQEDYGEVLVRSVVFRPGSGPAEVANHIKKHGMKVQKLECETHVGHPGYPDCRFNLFAASCLRPNGKTEIVYCYTWMGKDNLPPTFRFKLKEALGVHIPQVVITDPGEGGLPLHTQLAIASFFESERESPTQKATINIGDEQEERELARGVDVAAFRVKDKTPAPVELAEIEEAA